MEVSGKQHVKVKIDKTEQWNITDKFLQKMFDIPTKRCYINDEGNLMKWWVSGGGGHSWNDEEIVRKATANDKLYFKFIKKLEEKLRKEEVE